jgi:predicted AAA+ superfamily ATPase
MDRNILRIVLADQLSELFKEETGEIARNFNWENELSQPEVAVVTGVRRCGKSTLLRQHARKWKADCAIHYLNFEEQRLTRFEVDDFQTAYEEFLITATSKKKQILIYDELQLVEGWERWIAGMSSKKNIKIFISGSNSKLLSSELASLLTGRYRLLHVTPLSYSEILSSYPDSVSTDPALRHSTANKIFYRRAMEDYLQFGGFPRAFISRDTTILGQYNADIIEKDIALRRRVRNVSALKNLGSILASQNSRLLNQSLVSRDLGIKSLITTAKFCDYFLETFLYSEIRLFSRSKRGQLRGRSKFYAVDPLLAKQVGFHAGDSTYWILENHVCNEFLRRGYELYYWHSKNNYEVDFIARKKSGEMIAVQISISLADPKTREREFRALQAAKNELGIKELLVITRDEINILSAELSGVTVFPFYEWAKLN